MEQITIDPAAWAALHSPQHLFLTGDAGTGKTTLIKEIIKEHPGECIVLAPTGVAAVNAGGQTIHSFFQFPAMPVGYEQIVDLDKDQKGATKKKIIERTKYLIIDEVSMVRADLMDQIGWWFYKNFDSKDESKKFAGIKIIMVGDLSQLPPVVSGDSDKQMIAARYPSEFFFDAKVWKEYDTFATYRLNKVYRQTDPVFLGILNGIKNNSVTESDLNKFSINSNPEYGSSIVLTSTNAIASMINDEMLSAVDQPTVKLVADISGDFKKSEMPVDEFIILKKGCRIMTVRNDPTGKFVNGTIGEFVSLDTRYVDPITHITGALTMKLDDGTFIKIPRFDFESTEYTFDNENDQVNANIKGSFTQYPVRLAYAITIHKSQGKTFDKIVIDFGDRGAFAHGQVYVAVSRCRTLEGITLKQPITKKDIFFKKRVLEFNKAV